MRKGDAWRGRFKDGVCKGTVQTNGIPEDDNPTSMDVVRDALIANVMQSLSPWNRQYPLTSATHSG